MYVGGDPALFHSGSRRMTVFFIAVFIQLILTIIFFYDNVGAGLTRNGYSKAANVVPHAKPQLSHPKPEPAQKPEPEPEPEPEPRPRPRPKPEPEPAKEAAKEAALGGGMPLRIMMIGASVARGDEGTGNTGFRKPLRDWLTSIGNKVNMVGSERVGEMIDNDVEGHRSNRIDQAFDWVRKSVPGTKPNVAIINVGTNNCLQQRGVAEYWETLYRLVHWLVEISPSITIVLSTLITNIVPGAEPCVKDINSQIRAIYEIVHEEKLPVVLVEMHDNFIPAGDKMPRPLTRHSGPDGSHLDDEAYRLMADMLGAGMREADKRGYFQKAEPVPGILHDGDKDPSHIDMAKSTKAEAEKKWRQRLEGYKRRLRDQEARAKKVGHPKEESSKHHKLPNHDEAPKGDKAPKEDKHERPIQDDAKIEKHEPEEPKPKKLKPERPRPDEPKPDEPGTTAHAPDNKPKKPEPAKEPQKEDGENRRPRPGEGEQDERAQEIFRQTELKAAARPRPEGAGTEDRKAEAEAEAAELRLDAEAKETFKQAELKAVAAEVEKHQKQQKHEPPGGAETGEGREEGAGPEAVGEVKPRV